MATYEVRIEVEDSDNGSIATLEIHIEADSKREAKKTAKYLQQLAYDWKIETEDIIRVED